ncbi:MAG: hypothetical protein ACP5UI_00405 [Thermoprotei archaeon]|nr:hypothetical protein [TACK group archaeon]
MRSSKKALSSILGTIIVLVLTVAAGTMLWRTFFSLFSSLSEQNQLQIYDAEFVVTSAGSYLSLTVKNTGSSQVTVPWVSIEGVVNLTWGVQLQPGQEDSRVWPVPARPVGQSFLLLVEAYSAAGGSYQSSQQLFVQGE